MFSVKTIDLESPKVGGGISICWERGTQLSEHSNQGRIYHVAPMESAGPAFGGSVHQREILETHFLLPEKLRSSPKLKQKCKIISQWHFNSKLSGALLVIQVPVLPA